MQEQTLNLVCRQIISGRIFASSKTPSFTNSIFSTTSQPCCQSGILRGPRPELLSDPTSPSQPSPSQALAEQPEFIKHGKRPLSESNHSSRHQQEDGAKAKVGSKQTTFKIQTDKHTVDAELSAKFQSELQMEQEMMSEEDALPEGLQAFLDSANWELHDTPGEEEVILSKTFGNEKIRLSFNIADLNAMDQEPDYSQDNALMDEEMGGDASRRLAAEGNAAETQGDEMADEENEPSFPARVNITIEKEGVKGALQIEAIAQDGMIVIDNVYYFNKAEYADAKTADQDWQRRVMYSGPPYGNLDQDLQVLLERYIEERGVNSALALWIPEYIDHKEQKEYLNWLGEVKGFVDA
jgi:complement component 1 Q subcomponent-binding protein